MKNVLPILIAVLFSPLLALAQSGGSASSSTVATTTRAIRVPTLVYHSVRPYYPEITDQVKEFTVPPDIFDEQLKYLEDNGYTAITMDDLAQYLTSGKTLPAKPVMLTFDDGWQNQFVYAFPILQKHHMPAVFYVYARAIGKKHFLTWNQLKAMVKGGMEIAGHTYSHPELPKVLDGLAMSREIFGSKQILSDTMGGLAVKDFAYPFGEYDDRVVNFAKGAYQTARTVHAGNIQTSDSLYTLHGTIITGDFNRFVALVNK